MDFKNVGDYKYFDKCRFCFSANGEVVIDLGVVPLAGGFIAKNSKSEVFEMEKLFPLQLYFCRDCYLLQVNTSINPDTLFKNYFYFSSSIKTLVTYFQNFSENLLKDKKHSTKTHVVEIGCNDGELLKSFIAKGVSVTGVDPATNVVMPLIKRGVPIINDYFGVKVAEKIIKEKGKADFIVSFHSMAHIENMHDVAMGIKKLLKPKGVLAFEVHYLGNLILQKQYDMMYHEHQFYYSLHALEKFFAQYDMEIYDAQRSDMRGGSMIYYVQHKKTGIKKTSKEVKNLRIYEKEKKLTDVKTYKKYNTFIKKSREDLTQLLEKIKKDKATVIGYGASGRGTIIMNYCGLDKNYFEYVIDDAPAKWGAYCPGTHQKIIDNTLLATKKRPDYCVLFAWPFAKEVSKRNELYIKNGGKFIVPLPRVTIIP